MSRGPRLLNHPPSAQCGSRDSTRQCERAGVPYGRNTRDGLVLHDARHTATTHLLESNVSPKTVQEWMGWSDKAFVLYYSHASKQSREQAGRSLEELAGGRKTA